MSESTPYIPGERRPIASRGRPIWINTAHWLAQRRVSPNAISIAGMIAGMLAGVALAATAWTHGPAARLLWLAGAACVQLRLLGNLLDGMVAIESQRASPVGELFNEVPDRVSDAFTLVGLGFSPGGVPCLGWIAAILAIFTAYVRAAGKIAGAGQDFCGPMAKQHRMFIVTITCLYMALTPAKWHPLWRDHWGLPAAALAIIALGCVVTSWRRLRRAARRLGGGTP